MKKYIIEFIGNLAVDTDITTPDFTDIKNYITDKIQSQARVAEVRNELVRIGEKYEQS